MRSALERVHGTLSANEVPSKSFVGFKLEHVEENEPRVEDLSEVSSLDDGETQYLTGGIDHTTGAIKVRRSSASIPMPSSPEELRLRHRRIGLAWEMILTKHHNRAWLVGTSVECYRLLSDYILGPRVAGLSSKTASGNVVSRPSWQIILDYDHEIRKKAYELIRTGEMTTIALALVSAMRNAELRQVSLLEPMTLGSRADREGSSSDSSKKRPSDDGWAAPPQQFWKGSGGKSGKDKGGKGKGKGKGKGGKEWRNTGKNSVGLYTKIPQSGRLVCFGYQKNVCSGGCGMAHVCQQCLGAHPVRECKNRKKAGEEAK
jgi:hypothetical protein